MEMTKEALMANQKEYQRVVQMVIWMVLMMARKKDPLKAVHWVCEMEIQKDPY